MKTTYTIHYLDGTQKILCGKCSNKHRESDNPTLSYHINYRRAACESGKHK